MPLIYMKPIFEANYSRKLSSLKNRLVEQLECGSLPRSSIGQLYWIWAFESPQNVKLLVRQQLGEQNVSHVGFVMQACFILQTHVQLTVWCSISDLLYEDIMSERSMVPLIGI